MSKESTEADPLAWPIDFLAENEIVRSKHFGMTKEAKEVRYPIRLLRYWFGHQLLREQYELVGRPIEVCEIGVDVGQMLEFSRSSSQLGCKVEWNRWHAVEPVVKTKKLERVGYQEITEANLEDDAFHVPGEYDAVILLHVLEHLFDPEGAMRKVTRLVRPGGIVIGGFPVLPHFLIASREKQVRKTAKPMGHVSIFSPKRVVEMGKQAGLETDFYSGAYFMRSKGSALENFPAWLRFNLAWGKTLPWWPGEIYWRMRKPQADPASA